MRMILQNSKKLSSKSKSDISSYLYTKTEMKTNKKLEKL
jgi:hypothetical protein